ncbi:formylglycine-generating enzyme family protein [Achromobacter pestifer]|uniref:Formylglycine-generating enzyme family protein n=1 Tax=Achromobacter pestifer TaxID=1353889 RepID=A0A7D4IMH9_9BURK|nr:formylglycine-generating enzyme family protein [Achromobacter pestifer]
MLTMKHAWTAAALLCGIAAAGMYLLPGAGPQAGQLGDGRGGPAGMMWIPAGDFLMGSDSPRSQANERPAHPVRLAGFWIDRDHVTNRDFARFVAATGYVTTAERTPDWDTIRVHLPAGTPRPARLVPGALVFVGSSKPVDLNDYARWWRFAPGASWRQPQGPGSDIAGKDEHPVVQVSYEDAQTYAAWAGKRLPTEAEWEYAARGGLEQVDFAWGTNPRPDGKPMARTWDASRAFPMQSPKIMPGTEPVGSYPANGYGVRDMAGNAWQWVADWYRPDAFRQQSQERTVRNPAGPAAPYDPAMVRPEAPKRVIRGGSFLCSEDYCEGYRVSARQGQDPYSSASNVGFRLALSAADWNAQER